MAKLNEIRKHPWDHLTKNDYEEVTLRQQPYLHGHYRSIVDNQDYDIYDPRYTRLRCSDWEAYRDPKKFWYTPFISNRKGLSEEVTQTLANAEQLRIRNRMKDNWLGFVRDAIIPLRHLEYGSAVQLQHVIRYAMGSPIEQSATFEAFDKQGRAQWLTQLGLMWSADDRQYVDEAKQCWLESLEWEPLLRYVEEVLVTQDWAEVLVAINLCLDPFILRLMYEELTEAALDQGDQVFPVLALNCLKQLEWQEKWSVSLFKMFVQDRAESRWDYLKALDYGEWQGDYRWGYRMSDPRETPEEKESNVEILQGWIDKWHPKAYEAVLALQPIFDRYGIPVRVEEKLEKLAEQGEQSIFKAIGLKPAALAVAKS